MQKIILIILSLLLLTNCFNKENYREKNNHGLTNENLLEINKILVKKDAELIKSYISRRDWNMTEIESGLWYEIYVKGEGQLAQKDQYATISYSIELLDGTKCYEADSLHPKTFQIGHGQIESGIEDGILFMNKGAKGRFILPPHLAHGLVGDDNKIPPRATIIYNLSVLDIK